MMCVSVEECGSTWLSGCIGGCCEDTFWSQKEKKPRKSQFRSASGSPGNLHYFEVTRRQSCQGNRGLSSSSGAKSG